MSDIIERAEVALREGLTTAQYLYTLVEELLTELKAARAENEQLKANSVICTVCGYPHCRCA